MATGERRWRAMGSDCHVLVVTPDRDTNPHDHEAGDIAEQLVQLAVERVEILEQCWSRFRPSSELTRLNAEAGHGPVRVSDDLYLLVERMRDAWESSEGRFDPTVLSAITALGYDTDFAAISTRAFAAGDVAVGAAPGMGAVVLDPLGRSVTLPAGVGIDPGAIGKGLGADVIAGELMAAGAVGVLVNLGGDLVFAGSAPDDAAWSIGVEDERLPVDDPDRMIRVLAFPPGTAAAGIATSTTLKRRWAQGRRHHVIDPRTGTMAVSDLVHVTVITASAWEAEVTATTALLMQADEAAAWLRSRDITAILLTADRVILTDEETPDV